MHTWRYDANSALLNYTLENDIYMNQSKGFVYLKSKNKIWKLFECIVPSFDLNLFSFIFTISNKKGELFSKLDYRWIFEKNNSLATNLSSYKAAQN